MDAVRELLNASAEPIHRELVDLGFSFIYPIEQRTLDRDENTRYTSGVYFKRLRPNRVGLVDISVSGNSQSGEIAVKFNVLEIPVDLAETDLSSALERANDVHRTGVYPVSIWSQGELSDRIMRNAFVLRKNEHVEVKQLVQKVCHHIRDRLLVRLNKIVEHPVGDIFCTPEISVKRRPMPKSIIVWFFQWSVPKEIREKREDWQTK